jgi:hypothetical protein
VQTDRRCSGRAKHGIAEGHARDAVAAFPERPPTSENSCEWPLAKGACEVESAVLVCSLVFASEPLG